MIETNAAHHLGYNPDTGEVFRFLPEDDGSVNLTSPRLGVIEGETVMREIIDGSTRWVWTSREGIRYHYRRKWSAVFAATLAVYSVPDPKPIPETTFIYEPDRTKSTHRAVGVDRWRNPDLTRTHHRPARPTHPHFLPVSTALSARDMREEVIGYCRIMTEAEWNANRERFGFGCPVRTMTDADRESLPAIRRKYKRAPVRY